MCEGRIILSWNSLATSFVFLCYETGQVIMLTWGTMGLASFLFLEFFV